MDASCVCHRMPCWPLASCALVWGAASQRGHGPSPLGGAAQCRGQVSQPGPALTHPLATSMAFDTSTCPWISGQSKFPHWKDTGSSRLCDLLSASHPDSPVPGGVEVADPKPCSGKTGSAPSCYPPAAPSAVGLAAAKGPAGLWALTSPVGSHPTPHGHLQVEKREGFGERRQCGGGRWRFKVWLSDRETDLQLLAGRSPPGASSSWEQWRAWAPQRTAKLPSSGLHPVSSRLREKPGLCPLPVPFHFLVPKPNARERWPATVSGLWEF